MKRALAALLLFACAGAHAQQGGAYSADAVKAAFLYHFGSFVEWPPEARRDQALTIAVLGDAGVMQELRRLAAGQPMQGRPIRVREVSHVGEIGDAQILYVGYTDRAQLRRLLTPVQDRPVLTVTNIEGGLGYGSVINFAIVQRRVRFEISLPAAQRAGLDLSSRLLSIALNVQRSSAHADPMAPRRLALRPRAAGSRA